MTAYELPTSLNISGVDFSIRTDFRVIIDILIAMNADCSDLFQHFSDEYPEYALPVDHKAFIGFDAIKEFIITLSPPAIAALSAYLVARLSNNDITIKKGDIEIHLKGSKFTKDDALDMLKTLEQKSDDDQ